MKAKSHSHTAGANDRVNVGLIGFGLIGRFHMAATMHRKGELRAAVFLDDLRVSLEIPPTP